MSIIYDDNAKVFNLQANDTSYIFEIYKNKYLAHLYWGRSLKYINDDELLVQRGRCSFSPNPDKEDQIFSLDTLPQEYPSYGTSDFRTPAFMIQSEDGSAIADLKYQSHSISKGKPRIKGLPSTYVENDDEAETLKIVMFDPVINLKAVFYYTVFEKFDIITRNVVFINEGSKDIRILRALSMSVDFESSDFDFLHLPGSYARERYIERAPLITGNVSIESRRGASSHDHNPFMALMSKNADEDYGEVYGFSLIYSGSFLAQAEVDQYSTTRVSMGINPFDFSWLLKKGETFETPEVVMAYSCHGLGHMSRTYHELYRTRLCRGKFRDAVRPILANNWEATYFDFNASKIEKIAKTAKEVGIELFVLDDGWFGKRDNDKSSLGDWNVNKIKLPSGLEDLSNKIHNLGLHFGLWFEPEMVSPDSDLYRKHPDWCLHVPDRQCTLGRNQLVLDLSRKDVCDYIVEAVSNVLESAKIDYVKWDMNRNMTEIGSALLTYERQRETAHRYILGLYSILDKITSEFPDVLFESCSGGGGRFDPGMLYYMPQTWTSDDTDAIERIKIQYGTSIVYPASTMGAHVSAVPNHQVNRITSLKTRGDVAASGNLGYEVDLTKFTDQEKEEVRQQIREYKKMRELIQHGDMYRLLSPFQSNEAAWMFVSKDKSEAFVVYCSILKMPNAPIRRLTLKGLKNDTDYSVTGRNGKYSGDELMYRGLSVPDLDGDFQSIVWKIYSE